jgi:hypothetical protein
MESERVKMGSVLVADGEVYTPTVKLDFIHGLEHCATRGPRIKSYSR